MRCGFHAMKCVRLVSECEEDNLRHRDAMEDAHCIEDCFGGVLTQGYFAVYDGHGGTFIMLVIALSCSWYWQVEALWTIWQKIFTIMF